MIKRKSLIALILFFMAAIIVVGIIRPGYGGYRNLSTSAVSLQDPNDAARQGEFDTLFKIPVVIDVAHHEIHAGDSFHACGTDTSMGNSDTLILAFKTASGTKRIHLFHSFITLTGGHFEIIEGPTWTNQTGTKQPIYNRKREASMNSSSLLEDQAQVGFVASDNMILNPTGLSGGTAIHTHYAYGQKNQFTGRGRDIEEMILKPDTQYAIRFTADAASNAAQMLLDFYEHQDE